MLNCSKHFSFFSIVLSIVLFSVKPAFPLTVSSLEHDSTFLFQSDCYGICERFDQLSEQVWSLVSGDVWLQFFKFDSNVRFECENMFAIMDSDWLCKQVSVKDLFHSNYVPANLSCRSSGTISVCMACSVGLC